MRRIFIALIAGGLLLVSGVAASAKPDSSTGENGQHGQQQKQTQNDKRPADKPATTATTATKPAPVATRAATSAATSTASTLGQCGFQGEQTGEHDDAACKDQNGQAGANESKSEASDKADLPEKDNNQQGDNQD